MNDLTDEITISKLGSVLKLNSLVNVNYIIKTMKYITQNNIKIVHTIDPVLYMVGATAAHFTNIKHVRLQPNFIRKHEKLNCRTLKITPFEKWTDMFITYQYASAKDLNLAGVKKEKIVTIHGFSRPEELLYFNDIKDIRTELNIPKGNKIILAMHRMVENKGYETFIDMIPFIINDYPNVTFLLVGDGPLRHTYEDKVKELGVSKYVIFTGFRKDLANIIKQIDFGVYPLADTSAMGAVIRAGKVLITKKNSSMDEYIVDGKTGYLVPEDNAKVYAKYALKLLCNPKLLLKMEENQRNHVINNFDGIKNMRKLESIFISLCNNKTTGVV
jgi:glycosyltransferase involved in cell wall biosynthesis